MVPVAVEVAAMKWGPEHDQMQRVAEWLAVNGQTFDIRQSTPMSKPTLVLLDYRFREHVVSPGLWIVIHPGDGVFRILTDQQLELEYEDVR